MNTTDWKTNPDRKFAVNSLCRDDAITLIRAINECSDSVATHYVDSLVTECQQDAIKRGLVTNKVFLVHDDMNGIEYYIDTCYYMFPN